MLNQVILVGRICEDPEVTETESGKKRCCINLAVNRSFKNADGVYETDFIKCVIWNGIASNVAEYCKKGDIVGVKGRLQTNTYEDKDGKKQFSMEVITEKVSFLASKNITKNTNERDER